MTDEMRDKVARLPAWARDLIKRLEIQAEPNIEEIARLRREIEILKKQKESLVYRVEAMTEIFTGAAKQGNETAQAFVDRMIREYGPEVEPTT